VYGVCTAWISKAATKERTKKTFVKTVQLKSVTLKEVKEWKNLPNIRHYLFSSLRKRKMATFSEYSP
jgi:hypothetical protein